MNPALKKSAVVTGTFIILASASSLAWASGVTIPNSFTSGTPAKASEVNGNFSAVKTAVDDNDARISGVIANTQAGALKTAVDANTAAITAINGTNTTQNTDITNLKGNLTGGTCVTNNADDVMVRVGPICVDKYPASLWSSTAASPSATAITSMPAGCTVEGAGCSGADIIVAQSRATPGSALKDAVTITYAQAARACANAGKRLLTRGEWVMARGDAAIVGMTTDGVAEFIDAVGTDESNGASGVMQAGYVGQNLGAGSPGPVGQLDFFANQPYNATLATGTWLGFRCAR